MTKIVNKLVMSSAFITLPIIVIISLLCKVLFAFPFFIILSPFLLIYIILIRVDKITQKDDDTNIQNNNLYGIKDEVNLHNKDSIYFEKMQIIGYMSSTIIHDLNNLLTAIIGFSDLLLMRTNKEDQNYAHLSHIKKSTDKAAKLVLNMLYFIQQKEIKPKIISIQSAIQNIHSLMFWSVGKNIELSVDYDDDVKYIKINPTELEQIILNIVTNAKDAMESPGGKITIKVKNVFLDQIYLKKQNYTYISNKKVNKNKTWHGKYVVLSITDNGSGMDESIISQIFKPFKTSKANNSIASHSGSGLGLFNVQRIVSNAGGFIAINTKINKGTSFDLFFKEQEKKCNIEDSHKEKTAASTQAIKKINGKVLVVDNEESVRMSVSCALSNYGMEVIEAEDAETALSIMANHKNGISVLITDVSMNRMSGIELADKVRIKYPKVKTIIMSGYVDELTNNDIKIKYNFLNKPYTVNDLVAKVNDL